MAKLTILTTLVILATLAGLVTVTQATGMYLPSFRCIYENPVQPSVFQHTITQKLDNFNSRNKLTWEQKYYSNSEFYAPGGPIFVFLGGEWDITPYRMTISSVANLAEKLHGIIFYLEHRFYGESKPTTDTSDENLQFLTVEQALADIAHFVSYVNSDRVTPGENPVIVVGGHYAGSLAVWFRQKYPHLSTGAWASGAPLQSVVNFQRFNELAGAAYLEVCGQEAYNTIEEGFSSLKQHLADGRNDFVDKLFSTCDPITTDADAGIFMWFVSEAFGTISQLNHVYPIQGVCDTIMNGTAESEMHRIARHVDKFSKRYFKSSCVPSSYKAVVEFLREKNWDAPANKLALRPYVYQLCHELGWFHSTHSKLQPDGNSIDNTMWFRTCRDVFGEEFTEKTIESNLARFNSVFGGLNPGVTNTIFVHGDLDPWRAIGVQTQLNPSSPAIIISGASQVNDIYEFNEGKDSPQLLATKRTISEIISKWVNNQF